MVTLLATVSSGCSVRSLAIRTLGKALGDMGAVYASDDDPELVGQALPFALKTIEGLLAEAPDNQRLLLAACQGFTQYAYAFVEVEAERVELAEVDHREAERLRARALGLYLRARGYCLHALDLVAPGVEARLIRGTDDALAGVGDAHLELLFWTSAAWGAAISVALDQPEIVVDLPAVRTLLLRVLAIDPDWGRGLVQEAMMTLESLPAAMGGSRERAQDHYARALRLAAEQRAGTFVAWAKRVAVEDQDRALYERLLRRALEVELAALPDERLANRINQQRAELLLKHTDVFFFEDP